MLIASRPSAMTSATAWLMASGRWNIIMCEEFVTSRSNPRLE
jgi:hypothetical protein